MSTSERFHLCNVAEVQEGRCRVYSVGDDEVGVVRVEGELRAFRNVCPHHGAPICVGPVSGTMLPSEPGEYMYGLEGRIITCPWHAWQFDLLSGRTAFDVDRRRLIQFPLELDGDELYVLLPRRPLGPAPGGPSQERGGAK